MEFLFKHFGKLWVIWMVIVVVLALSMFGLLGWAIIKLVNHFTATPVTAALTHVLPYLS